MGIRGRLLALTMGVVVPLAVSGLAGLQWVWTASRDQLDASVRKQAELAAAAFERWVDAERQPLVALAASESGRPDSQPLTEQELASVIGAHPNWRAVEEVGADGRTVLSVPAGAPPLDPELAASLRSTLDGGAQSAVQVDWELAGGRPVFVIAAPLDDGKWLNARVDGTAASEVVSNIPLSEGSVMTLFDPRRRIIHRSPVSEGFVGRNMSDSPVFLQLDEARSLVRESVSRNDGVMRVYGIARVGSTGCVASVGIASAELYEPARAQFNRYLLFSLVALACAAAASIVIARTIAIPVRDLSEAARRLGGGDLSVRAPDLGDGEMAELSRVFNTMARSLEEREAKLAELDRLKSEFVSSVSHELRTPLTTIKTLTQVMQRGGETPEDRRRYLEAIASECDRQIDLVLNLLDLSRIEAGAFAIAPECVDVAEIVSSCETIERFAVESAGHRLVTDVPADLPYVRADRVALRRVVRCLVENAVKYTPRGGRITISAAEAGGSVAIAVADTGRGIEARDFPHLFEKFYRCTDGASGEPHGVGLGLYLAKTIVEHLGGTLSVESEVGRGSTFTVTLPRWATEPAGADTTDQEKPHAKASADR